MDIDQALDLLKDDPEEGVRYLKANKKELAQLRIDREEALELLKAGEAGIREWNAKRAQIEIIESIFFQEGMKGGVSFSVPDLKHVDLTKVNLPELNLRDAKLERVDFSGANLRDANFSYLNLGETSFRGADLRRARFFNTNLWGANLRGANLCGVHFSGTQLQSTDFWQAKCWDTVFANVDLSGPFNLHGVEHLGPSEISTSTFILSKGQIPDEFLRGCGVPDSFIDLLPSLTTDDAAFYSCFISYSHKDEEFAKKLYSRLREEKLRVWFAPENIKGGTKLHEQIYNAIETHDRLLLVLSSSSIQSEWVISELRKARRIEHLRRRRVLFPIGLIDFDELRQWECFDADTGKDLAVEIREYYIPDFSKWKSDDDFEKAFVRLLIDLRATKAT